MKFLILLCIGLLLSTPALAHWHFNEDGGFGIYQPEGWRIRPNGRSSRLLGPEKDSAQSEIFLGSDWVSRIASLDDLARHVRAETGATELGAATISGLQGYQVGSKTSGAIYLLRVQNNVIVVEYSLRGSPEQIEEGETILSSIDIKTKPIEN